MDGFTKRGMIIFMNDLPFYLLESVDFVKFIVLLLGPICFVEKCELY